ncbi:hypothetical protein Aab01nite_01070 [Paractinoplanes abujensis]|uniref:Uncharacterized protein n=1 Tax=Paractinoplanes abujensis TaxID=882441 RepID=A0A7W7CP03_9ACTN|nr:hypothetical protein [Actinoplanes abujensis]MBB4692067.1 hypothetical protein [Actinoplanes abujensis]GID16517.1 hypothetical protein Aab01nite_01070 [Actinoplanes abujensis]
MKISHVTTAAGQPVTLLFEADRVQVVQVSQPRQRAVRAGAGGLILAAGLALVAVNAGDRGIPGLELGLWIAAGVAVVAALAGVVSWFVLTRCDRGADAETIAASSVVGARSRTEPPKVIVSLTLAEGGERQFEAVGHAGALLSAGFGRLLSV